MGEKRIGSNKIAEKTLTENLYTDKTKKLNTAFIAYNNENENIELKTSKSVPKDKIQIKVRYDADNVKDIHIDKNLYNDDEYIGDNIYTVSYTHLDVYKRQVVERDGNIIMVDDDRMKLRPGEKIEHKSVRFRTLGCYPLTGGIESTAHTLDEIIDETLSAVDSERTSRVIDHDGGAASMERRKKEGYF